MLYRSQSACSPHHYQHLKHFPYLFASVDTHTHTGPILLFTHVNRASWFISWIVTQENRGAFLGIPWWGEHQGWEELRGERGMSVDVSDSQSVKSLQLICLHSTGPQKLAMLAALDTEEKRWSCLSSLPIIFPLPLKPQRTIFPWRIMSVG